MGLSGYHFHRLMQGDEMEDVIVDVMGPSLLALAPAFACVHVLVEKATLSWGARLNAALPELQRICHHLGLALQFAQTSSSQQTQVCSAYCPCRMLQPSEVCCEVLAKARATHLHQCWYPLLRAFKCANVNFEQSWLMAHHILCGLS